MSRRLVIDQGFAGCRHGSLTVIEAPASREHLNERLAELNPALFLERQLSAATEEPVWCVCLDTGRDGIIVLFEWRETLEGDSEGSPSGPPISYPSMRIVDEFQRRYQRGPLSVKQIQKQNDEKRAREKKDANDDYRALIEEHAPLASEMFSSLFHRGQGLRMARDRMRARGHKV